MSRTRDVAKLRVLAIHVLRARIAVGMNPARVSDAAGGAPGPRAPSRQLFPLKVTACAWCGNRSVEGIWDELDVVLHTFITGRRHIVSHGMVRTFFELK